jgi:galactonate dehydratase
MLDSLEVFTVSVNTRTTWVFFAKGAEIEIDCHSRLRVGEVAETIDRLAEFGVSWLEEPVRDTTNEIDQIAAFRKQANARGILPAVAENCSGLAAISELMCADCYDVVMPDIIVPVVRWR